MESLTEGFLNFMVNMGHHGVIEDHDDPQVANSFWGRYAVPDGLPASRRVTQSFDGIYVICIIDHLKPGIKSRMKV